MAIPPGPPDLEGTIEYTRGDQTILAKAGSMIQILRGSHKFRNVGSPRPATCH